MAADWEAKRQRALSDPRSTQELINIALTDTDEDQRVAWEAVSVLHERGNRAAFEAARELCASDDPDERAWGMRILAQLGVPERSFPAESLALLLRLLEREKDADLLAEIGFALGHIGDVRAVGALARLSRHPSSDVRYSVVHALLGQEAALAIRTLIELSSDDNRSVRDWATFGLGTQIDTDTSEIREALLARLADEDNETRGEAFIGLARRKDERVTGPLIRELSGSLLREQPPERAATLAVEAARDNGDPRLYPVLIRLREWWGQENELLEEAIANCKDAT